MITITDATIAALVESADAVWNNRNSRIEKLEEELDPLNELILKTSETEVQPEDQNMFNELQGQLAIIRTEAENDMCSIADKIGEYVVENAANDDEIYDFFCSAPINTVWDEIALHMGEKYGKRIADIYWARNPV